MSGHKYSLYLIFASVFLMFHLTGFAAGGLPYILNAAITFTVVFTLILLLDKWYSGNSYKQVIYNSGFHRTSIQKILPGILTAVLILSMYPLFYLTLGFKITLNNSWLLNLAGLLLTGGLAEEMFFRGFLFRHLRDEMSFKKASLTSMLLFAAAHLMMFTYMDWSVALFSTILAVAISIPMSFLYEISDNTVWSPAIVHTIVRTIGLVVTAPEDNFLQMTMIWMTGCMIIPCIIVLFSKSFWKMWRSHSTDKH